MSANPSDILVLSTSDDSGKRVSWKLDLPRGDGFHDFIRSFLDRNFLYEPDVTGFLVRALRLGDTFVDVGANLGWFTCLGASAVGRTGKVYAFEPGPGNVRELVQNIEHNAFANVSVVAKACSDTTGTINLYINASNTAGHALWDPAHFPGNAPTQTVISLDAVALDDYFVSRDAHIRALKVDTEGAEEKVLRGAETLIRTGRIDFVVAELHVMGLRELGHSQMSLRQFMASAGYDCFLLNFPNHYPRQVHEGVPIESNAIVNLLFCKPSRLAEIWPRFQVHETMLQS